MTVAAGTCAGQSTTRCSAAPADSGPLGLNGRRFPRRRRLHEWSTFTSRHADALATTPRSINTRRDGPANGPARTDEHPDAPRSRSRRRDPSIDAQQRATHNRLEEVANQPVLHHRRGSGKPDSMNYAFWLTPTPTRSVTIRFTWPEQGLPAAGIYIDGATLQRASAEATELWP